MLRLSLVWGGERGVKDADLREYPQSQGEGFLSGLGYWAVSFSGNIFQGVKER